MSLELEVNDETLVRVIVFTYEIENMEDGCDLDIHQFLGQIVLRPTDSPTCVFQLFDIALEQSTHNSTA